MLPGLHKNHLTIGLFIHLHVKQGLTFRNNDIDNSNNKINFRYCCAHYGFSEFWMYACFLFFLIMECMINLIF